MAHLAAALFLALLIPPATVGSNSVAVCAPALNEPCQVFSASALDPTLRTTPGAGQLAVVDPETGALVTPTGEQVEELATELAFEEKELAEAQPQVITLPDGTVRLHFPTGFRIQLEARHKAPRP